MAQTKQYEEIRLKLESLGDGMYPKSTPKRQPHDRLPDICTSYGKENKYVASYDRRMRAESHQDLLHQRLFEPDDRIYWSVGHIFFFFVIFFVIFRFFPFLDLYSIFFYRFIFRFK